MYKLYAVVNLSLLVEGQRNKIPYFIEESVYFFQPDVSTQYLNPLQLIQSK